MVKIANNSIISNWLKKKNWSLYKHQLEVLSKSSNGQDVLLISPTGTGKTLAGFLPSLVDCTLEKIRSQKIHTLYISPLKSLAYDVERNLLKPIKAMGLGLNVQSRTGDTSFNKKKNSVNKTTTNPCNNYRVICSFDVRKRLCKIL